MNKSSCYSSLCDVCVREYLSRGVWVHMEHVFSIIGVFQSDAICSSVWRCRINCQQWKRHLGEDLKRLSRPLWLIKPVEGNKARLNCKDVRKLDQIFEIASFGIPITGIAILLIALLCMFSYLDIFKFIFNLRKPGGKTLSFMVSTHTINDFYRQSRFWAQKK